MPNRLVAMKHGMNSVLGLTAIVLLVTALLIAVTALGLALRSSHRQVDNFQGESACRARSAIAQADAEGRRDDIMAELQETIARLFNASINRDVEGVNFEAAKLPRLSDEIRASNEVIRVARDDRLLSVDRCAEES